MGGGGGRVVWLEREEDRGSRINEFELLQHREAVADDKKEGLVFVRSRKVPLLGKNDSLSKNLLLFFL